jgi:uncharacterized protein YeaO (DUF488 family)
MKDVAPSPDLRHWFNHEPQRFAEFSRRYKQELRGAAALEERRKLGKDHVVTLLYGAHDPHINHAAVLLSVLGGRRRAQVKTAKALSPPRVKTTRSPARKSRPLR